MAGCGSELWAFACFGVCPDEAEGSAMQPHEGADAQDKQGGSLYAHTENIDQVTVCRKYTTGYRVQKIILKKKQKQKIMRGYINPGL